MGLNSASIFVRRNFYAVHKQKLCSSLIHGRAGVVEKNQFSSQKQISTQLCCRASAPFRSRNLARDYATAPSSANLSLLVECTTQIDCNTTHFPLSGKLFRSFGGKFNKEENFRRIFSNHRRPSRPPTPTTLESGTFGQLSRPLCDTFASGRPNFTRSATFLF